LDYSQVELRVLAHLSQDPALLEAFNNEQDIHARTARAIFGFGDTEVVPPEERAKAKAVNFGVIYGKSAFSLAKELGIPRAEAARFIDEYFNLYAGVKDYMERVIEEAKETASVSTLLGRRRQLRDIASKNYAARSQAERIARNTPIQGTAADLLKLAMIRVDKRIETDELSARMLLTVHDELVFEVPEVDVDEVWPVLKLEMENALPLSVPLTVDVGRGNCWADAH
jgi:DNA polymerase-1